MQIMLRPASEDDASFVYSLVETTMRGYVEKTWGGWDERGVRKFFREAASRGTLEMVCESGTPVGALAVQRYPTHFQLEELFLMPRYQKQGIGSLLVRRLTREADTAALPIRLRVLAVNPAVSFYERLGFVTTAKTRERFTMEYKGSGDRTP